MWKTVALAVAICAIAAPHAQESDPRLTGLDAILDPYVRDGEVYYRALKSDRGKLDAYVSQLAGAQIDRMSNDERLAFWLNAYNALVLRTVIDHYPIQGRSPDYPKVSIRQIPGAFERLPHRVAGKSLTLDDIEKTLLPEFNDPRAFLALGRGAEGGGRLRSEAYSAPKLAAQLAEVAAECVSRQHCFHIDEPTGKAMVSAIFSWREKEFAEKYAAGVPAPFANRTPIERAVLAFVYPRLLTSEKEILEKNTFQIAFRPFDWRLNDLTGRGGR